MSSITIIDPYFIVNIDDRATSICGSLFDSLFANTIDGYPNVLSCSFKAILLTWTAFVNVSFIFSPVTSNINSLYPNPWIASIVAYNSSKLAAFTPKANLRSFTNSTIPL